MPLDVLSFSLGPMENNTYLLADSQTRQAVVVDPSFESDRIQQELQRRGLALAAIWLTHAHFDHIAGVGALPAAPVGLHPADLPLWRQGGGARMFGIDFAPLPDPSFAFGHGQTLQLGDAAIAVRHAPGHTPGHVIFYLPESGLALVGDVIFYHGVGRTDLPGGSFDTLAQSIRTQVFTLPPGTRLLNGHGQETTVQEEQGHNPFL